MWTCLPELATSSNRQPKERERKNRQTPPKLNYKGITLKEYFRICDQPKTDQTLKLIKQESRASSNSSFAETPTFHQQYQQRAVRSKFKTESCEAESENQLRINTLKSGQSEGIHKMNAHSLQKVTKGAYIPMKKKEQRKKMYTKITSNPTKECFQLLNRSTLNSFYQLEENKKKMLKKLQLQKERANGLRLSDAFFITKYGSRFKIDCKAVKQE